MQLFILMSIKHQLTFAKTKVLISEKLCNTPEIIGVTFGVTTGTPYLIKSNLNYNRLGITR